MRKKTRAIPPSRRTPPTPPTTPPMMFLLLLLKPPPLLPPPCVLGTPVKVPVVKTCAEVLVMVTVISTPSLWVVNTLVNSVNEVERRGVVMMLSVVLGAEDTTLLDCCGVLDVGLALVWPLDCGGALDFGGSEVAGSEGEFGVDTGGLLEDVGGRAEEVTGGGVLAVPLACRFWPWCRYASMPSMFRSSRLKADEKVARKARARRARRCGTWWMVWKMQDRVSGCAEK